MHFILFFPAEFIKKSGNIEDISRSIYNVPAHSEVNSSANRAMFSKSEELNKDSSYVEDDNLSKYNVPVGNERRSVAEREKFTISNAKEDLSKYFFILVAGESTKKLSFL